MYFVLGSDIIHIPLLFYVVILTYFSEIFCSSDQELLKRDLTRNKGGSRLSIYYLLLIAVLSILLVHIFGSLMLSSDFS